ncbi:MAG: putative dehydrogenase [Candidatus Bathyarchaeota archaeon B24]|nr:MAG: putative dehydrogenase [Candidatus Bathyarchaeota archaeon B24]RLI25278.1 MAG: gfo/Idh/MocA family oxidoreductase [Candidatus Bathyarchaeota archaeon]
MERVRVGVIGCGGIAIYHLSNLIRVPEAEVVALADVNPASRDRVLRFIPVVKNAPFFKDYMRMLDEVEMDAVEILTPHALHHKQIIESLERGLHVLVEKPMVCNTEQALDVVRRAEASGKVVMVSYQRHLMGRFRLVKRLIAEGRIGRVRFIQAFLAQNWLEFSRGTWRQDPKLSCGGQLIDSGSHILDFVLWATGLTPEEVYAYSDNLGAPVDVNTAIALKFKEGAEGCISIIGDLPDDFIESYIFLGDRGMITLDERGLRLIERGKPYVLEASRYPQTKSPDQGFVDTILGRSENPAPPMCGLRVAQLTDAIYKAISEGSPVKLKNLEAYV